MTNKVGSKLGVAASIAAIVAIPLTVWQLAAGSGEPDKNGCTVINQSGNRVGTINCGNSEPSSDLDDVDGFERLRQDRPWLEARAPTGDGPWPYVVGGTGGQGLYVRDGYAKNDSRIKGSPTIPDGVTVFAYCAHRDGWEASPGNGRSWLRIAYPQPRDDTGTWIYAWWTIPAGHDGGIPDC